MTLLCQALVFEDEGNSYARIIFGGFMAAILFSAILMSLLTLVPRLHRRMLTISPQALKSLSENAIQRIYLVNSLENLRKNGGLEMNIQQYDKLLSSKELTEVQTLLRTSTSGESSDSTALVLDAKFEEEYCKAIADRNRKQEADQLPFKRALPLEIEAKIYNSTGVGVIKLDRSSQPH
jgi:hypothetical protein